MNLLVFLFLISITKSLENGNEKDGVSGSKETSSQNSEDIKRYADIVKSPIDERTYRGLELTNNLKVLLISDPSTILSAASMTVGVGALNDFRDIPGLASFVGLLMMRGGAKYPSKSDLEDFLDSHSGFIDNFPQTEAQEQTFSFDIESEFLAPALEKFAQFFLAPQLDKLTTDDLKSAISLMEIGYQNRMKEEKNKISEVEKLTYKKNHPFAHLFFGNQETLFFTPVQKEILESKIKVRNGIFFKLLKKVLLPKILQFYSMSYSSNIMSLAVLGKENLDELEKLVVPLFEKISNKNVNKLQYPFKFHPLSPEQLGQEIYIAPESDRQSLRVFFPVPDTSHQYKTNPAAYVKNFIEQEGPNSLFYVLRKEGYCTNIEANNENFAGVGLFVIEMNLTVSGLRNRYTILNLLFQYIHLLQEKGIQECFFQDQKKLDEIYFFYERNLEPLNYAELTSSALQMYPMKDVTSHSFLRDCWNPSLIADFLSHLTSTKMNYSLISESLESITDQQEKWYQTRYKIRKMPNHTDEEQKQAAEKAAKLAAKLKLPEHNILIAEDFFMYPAEENESIEPHIIHQSSISRFWFKQEIEYGIPELFVNFQIFCPSLRWDPSKRLLFGIFAGHLGSTMQDKYSWYANTASFEWNVHEKPMDLIIEIKFNGYNDKMPIFIEKFFSIIKNMENDTDETKFQEMKLRFLAYWRHFDTKSYIYQLAWYLRELMSASSWRKGDSEAAATGIHYEHAVTVRNSDLYGYSVFFQFSPESMLYEIMNLMGLLFLEIVKERCNSLLSEDEGHTEKCSVSTAKGQGGILIILISKKSPTYIDSRVEEFLEISHKILKDLTISDFESYTKKLETVMSEKPSDLEQLTTFYWKEITEGSYDFEEKAGFLEHLLFLRPVDVLNFFEEVLDKSSPTRRKVTILIIPEAKRNNFKNLKGATKIRDQTMLKSTFNFLTAFSHIETDLPGEQVLFVR